MSFSPGPWRITKPGCGLLTDDELSISSAGIQVKRAGVSDFPWGKDYLPTGSGRAEVTYGGKKGALECKDGSPRELTYTSSDSAGSGGTWTALEGAGGGGGTKKPPKPPEPPKDRRAG